MPNILIENGAIVTINNDNEVISPGYIFTEDDKIAALGAGPAPDYLRRRADTLVDATLMAVMPGMVNAHTHLFQIFLRGLADDKPLLEWLKSAIWPVACALTEEDAYVAGLVGFLENIRSGATAVVDHQYVHTDPRNSDGICRAAAETGIRLLLARGWADHNYHPTFMESPAVIVSEMQRLLQTWQGAANGRIRVEFGPLIPWGCSDQTMQETYRLAQEWGIGTHIHAAETQAEVEMLLQSHRLRHIEWLDSLGALGPTTHLVHSVWLSEQEIDLIAQKKAIVVHCPVSNMYLASGIAPIVKLKQKGVTIALASDGPGSNNSQNMLETLKMTACLQKVGNLDAMALYPEDVLVMACRGGAATFGQPELIGSLEVGKKADIVLVDLDSPFSMPVHKIPSTLVYSTAAGQVDTVIIDGRIVMRAKQITVMDEKAILARARAVCDKLFERAQAMKYSLDQVKW
ncbi:MAG: amidohydrolase [Anaerolineae bacterium]|nr:amidohydrolase [Anaerolineae bacterium]